MPAVSIVLPVYNGERYIRESIDSVIAQTFTDWELIIVDDHSTDKTPEIIAEYAASNEKIKIITHETNLKLPRSLNDGFKTASGDYLTWTSDDNIYYSSAVGEMYEYLRQNESAPMVTADMVIINEKGEETGNWNAYEKELMACHNCVGACFLYRKETAARVGAYNENLYMAEDYEYWLRIMFEYGDIAHIGKTLYKYRVHSGRISEEEGASDTIVRRLYDVRIKYIDELIALSGDREDYRMRLYYELLRAYPVPENIRDKFLASTEPLKMEAELNDKPVIVYGAGQYGDTAYEILGDKIAYYSDKNNNIIGKTKNGIKIISPRRMAELAGEYQIAAAVYYTKLADVFREFKDLGINSCTTVQRIMSERRKYQ